MNERTSSRLRTHLTAARSEYIAARYPGDLGDELLPSRMRIGFAGRLAWTSVAAAAVAATVVLAVWMHRPSGRGGTIATPTNEQWAIATQSTATPFTVAVATDASVNMPLASAPPAVPTEV